jgi:hypothetical protein
MPVDGFNKKFTELAESILPAHFSRLFEDMKSPFPSAWIRARGIGPATVLRKFRKTEDFPGCYVFVENGRPLYVGISRGVIDRLFQHLKSKNHFSSSRAYFMAEQQNDPGGTRDQNMVNPAFRLLFEAAQKRLEACSIATVQIDNPLELYVFEAYAAMELRTVEFNTFGTH